MCGASTRTRTGTGRQGCNHGLLVVLGENGRFESKLAHIMNLFYAIVDCMMICII